MSEEQHNVYVVVQFRGYEGYTEPLFASSDLSRAQAFVKGLIAAHETGAEIYKINSATGSVQEIINE